MRDRGVLDKGANKEECERETEMKMRPGRNRQTGEHVRVFRN